MYQLTNRTEFEYIVKYNSFCNEVKDIEKLLEQDNRNYDLDTLNKRIIRIKENIFITKIEVYLSPQVEPASPFARHFESWLLDLYYKKCRPLSRKISDLWIKKKLEQEKNDLISQYEDIENKFKKCNAQDRYVHIIRVGDILRELVGAGFIQNALSIFDRWSDFFIDTLKNTSKISTGHIKAFCEQFSILSNTVISKIRDGSDTQEELCKYGAVLVKQVNAVTSNPTFDRSLLRTKEKITQSFIVGEDNGSLIVIPKGIVKLKDVDSGDFQTSVEKIFNIIDEKCHNYNTKQRLYSDLINSYLDSKFDIMNVDLFNFFIEEKLDSGYKKDSYLKLAMCIMQKEGNLEWALEIID